jgi:hypothetical protein
MTVAAAVELTLTPLRRRWRRSVKRADYKTTRRIQWGYLLLSLTLLWWMLGYTETHHAKDWVGQATLSILYFAAFALLAALLVPRNVWTSFACHTSGLVKLGVVVNYLTLLLLLQNFIGAWWTRTSILAGLFVVSWAGSWVLCRFFWPAYLGAANIIVGGPQNINPSDPQGRSGIYD